VAPGAPEVHPRHESAAGHLRFSYANSLDNIQEALRRIEGWITK
jgi:aspartate/methionine/tyrosine aminotransferase